MFIFIYNIFVYLFLAGGGGGGVDDVVFGSVDFVGVDIAIYTYIHTIWTMNI